MARQILDEFLKFGKEIYEVHISSTNTDKDLHLIASKENILPLKKIPKIKQIPLVLEHGEIVGQTDLMKEKKTVEQTLEN